MPTFKDTHGREWSIKFDGLLLADLRQAHQINLADLSGADYFRLEQDASCLVTAVCHLVREQLAAAGLTKAQLAAALTGAVLDTALLAVLEAAELFFPPARWSALASSCKTLRDQWQALAPAMAMLAQPGIPPLMVETLTEAIFRGLANSVSPTSAAQASAGGPATNLPNAASVSPERVESAPRD